MEAVSGLDFMDYVDKYILDPIGLDDTFAPGGDQLDEEQLYCLEKFPQHSA